MDKIFNNEKITIDGKDLSEEIKKIFICIFQDLRSNRCGLNISTEKNVFGFMFDPTEKPNFGIGGELTMENIKAMRDFLTDVLEGKA